MKKNIDMLLGIERLLVKESDRLSFYPKYFGQNLMMKGEACVFDWMSKLCKDYSGGYWHFYSLSNGGFYLSPEDTAHMTIFVEGNGFLSTVSSDAAGIIATTFALSQLINSYSATQDVDYLHDHYERLRDYVFEHQECRSILNAID